MPNLTDNQSRAVERIAYRRGVTCEQCGSDQPLSTGQYMLGIGSRVSVFLYCGNRDAPHPKSYEIPSIPLSPEEVREAGIPVRESNPNPRRRPPGGLFPQ